MQKQLDISKNILPKIPQFWETPGAAFAELVQNAFRAGATEIHIQVDVEAGKLSVRDNGQGIQSLEDFLTIGDSAWDDEIIEPAGMGFYAHFGYSKTTSVRSQGKRYVFTPECLQGAPVEIRPFDRVYTERSRSAQDKISKESAWTEIAVEGIESKVLTEIDFARMRPLPHAGSTLTYTLNGKAVPNMLEEMTPLETSAGKLYLRRTTSPVAIPSGVWQGLPVGYTQNTRLYLQWPHSECVWWVDPASGVRPRLPGREAFIQDDNYNQALAIIAQEIETYCWRRVAQIDLQTLPETLTWRQHDLWDALERAGITETIVVRWARENLYYPARYFEGVWIPDEYGVPDYPEDNTLRVRRDKVIRFHIPDASLYPSGGEVAEVLLNSQVGQWSRSRAQPGEANEILSFVYDEAAGHEIVLEGLRREHHGWAADKVCLGEQTILAGAGLFVHAGEQVWIGDPRCILEKAAEFADLWHYSEYERADGEVYDFIAEDNQFDLALLQRHLAATYGLGEDINLHNWLQTARKSMAGWNGIPQKYLSIFQAALDEAEQAAVEAGYNLV
jgi:hypothetical protein